VKAAKAGIWQDVESSAPNGHTRKWRWPMEWTSRKERNKVMGVEIVEDPYVITPWWHPMRWIFRCSVRRRIHAEPWDGTWWEYAWPKTAARNVLEERYGQRT
jgi:hypothetical protein